MPLSRFRLLAFALLLVAGIMARPSRALQLTWADGSKNITVSSVAVCTLLVRPSAPMPVLPQQWQLLWTGTGVDTAFVVLNSPGPAEAAPTCSVTGPQTTNEELSHQTTVEFCGPGDGASTAEAAFVVRIDPSLRARIAVVPTSSMGSSGVNAITPEAEVTVNGGSSYDYPAAVWSAVFIPDSNGVQRAGVAGIGMDKVRSVVLRASNSEQAQASRASLQMGDTLEILTQTGAALTVQLPAGVTGDQTLVLGTEDGASLTTAMLSQSAQYDTTSGTFYMPPPWPWRAKDFAFIYAGGYFHIFYIREDKNAIYADSTERGFGHAISTDLCHWTHLDGVVPIRPGKFDGLHVWAPTIAYIDGTYYMS